MEGTQHKCASDVYFYNDISSVVNIAHCADGLFSFNQRKLMGDDALQIPLAAGHDLLHIPHIRRHIAAGADHALLGVGRVE